jgi:hypothetical protein
MVPSLTVVPGLLFYGDADDGAHTLGLPGNR